MSEGDIQVIVRGALKSWTALELAVHHGFTQSVELKYEELVLNITELCVRNMDQSEVSAELEESIYHDFNFMVEDGSVSELSRELCLACQELRSGAVLANILQRFPGAHSAVAASQKGATESEEVDEDMALDEMTQSLDIGNNKENKVREEPIVDDDGFTLVQKRRR